MPGIYGDNAHWGLRVQAVMIAIMIAYNGGVGLTPSQASDGKNGVPHALPRQTLYRWKEHYEWFGETPLETSRRHKGSTLSGRKKIVSEHVKGRIRSIIEANPSLYLDEIRTQLRMFYPNVWYSQSSIRRCIVNDLQLSLKILTMKATQADALEREIYKRALRTVKHPKQFVFIDESSVAKDDTRRRRGRSRRGVPVFKHAVFMGDNQPTYTLLGAVDINGFVIEACDVVWRRNTPNNTMSGTVDTNRFLQWVEDCLVPTLGNFQLGERRSVVVMDNAPIHNDIRIINAIEAAGAIIIRCARYSRTFSSFSILLFHENILILFLFFLVLLFLFSFFCVYFSNTADLNPIELCFHQYKAFLRRFSRSFYGLPWILFHHHALKKITRENMINYYGGKNMDNCIDLSPIIKKKEEAMIATLIGAGIIDVNPPTKRRRLR